MSNEDVENEVTLIRDKIDDNEENIIPTNRIASETIDQLEQELNKFRLEWKKEISGQEKKANDIKEPGELKNLNPSNKPKNVAVYHEFSRRTKPYPKAQVTDVDEAINLDSDLNYEQPTTNEDKAKYLFEKGVILEQQGRHYEAIKFYRMAMQLDPDIEFKASSIKQTKVPQIETKDKTFLSDLNEQQLDSDLNANEQIEKSLYELFQEFVQSENKYCSNDYPQKTTHFSKLPFEVIVLILKWVVSEHLDMRSLDRFSSVCKGFYVCARDPEIWKLACAKVWGANNLSDYLPIYPTWREMYLKRPRLNLDGVYISKASYARAGEQSLDNFYRPWHLVEYYRYLRFFSNGTVLFLTSPDDPKTVVSKLKTTVQINTTTNVNTSYYQPFILNEHSILKGKWSLGLNKISISLSKKILKSSLNKTTRRQTKEPIMEQEHVYKMELELVGKMNNQLQWSNYEIDVINKATNVINVTKFDLNKIDFPNFYFSRVKSYCINTEAPLK